MRKGPARGGRAAGVAAGALFAVGVVGESVLVAAPARATPELASTAAAAAGAMVVRSFMSRSSSVNMRESWPDCEGDVKVGAPAPLRARARHQVADDVEDAV